MYKCEECGWTGNNLDQWEHNLFDYVQGSEDRLMCIPIGACPGKDDEEYNCGASIFEPTALAELQLMTEMLSVLESIHFQHRGLDPAVIAAIGKARRLGWSPQRMRSPIDFKE